MLPVKAMIDPVQKNMYFDVDGETFTAECDARHFAASEDMLKVLKDLVQIEQKIVNMPASLTSLAKRSNEIIAFVEGTVIVDAERLENVRKLHRDYTRGLINVTELITELGKFL